ncbi:hypothetical protein ACQ4LE_008073 [Meloidogyne hapla]
MSDSADSPVKDLGKSPDKKKPKIQSPKKQSRSSGPSSSEQKNVSHGKIQSPQKQSGSSGSSSSEQKNVSHGKIQSPQKQSGSSGSSSSEQKNVSHGKQSGSSGSSSSEQKTPLTEQSSNITIDIKEYDKLLKDKIELENKTRELEKLRQFVKENRMTDKKVKFLNSLEELPDDGMEKMMEYANDPKFFCDLVRKAEDEFKFMELDRKHSGEAKVYTPESLLKDAKDYVEKDPSDTIQGCEKTWLSFAAATKLVYAKVGVSFSSHNAVIGLGYLAIVSNKRIDLLTPCESADLAHRNHYNGTNYWEAKRLYHAVQPFIEEYTEFKIELIKQAFESIIEKYDEDGKEKYRFKEELISDLFDKYKLHRNYKQRFMNRLATLNVEKKEHAAPIVGVDYKDLNYIVY